jgi:hypothetical protein
MTNVIDIFSIIEKPQDDTDAKCECSCATCDGRNDQVNLTNVPLMLNIYRGSPFELELSNIPDTCETLTFKCECFNNDFKYNCDTDTWIMSLSDSDTISLEPNTYTYYVYMNDNYLYTGELNVRDNEYYTNGIGQVKYKLEMLQSICDNIQIEFDKLNARVDTYDSRIEAVETASQTAYEQSQINKEAIASNKSSINTLNSDLAKEIAERKEVDKKLEEEISKAGKIDDVLVNGVSVVSNKVANIDLSEYAKSSDVENTVTEKINTLDCELVKVNSNETISGISETDGVISVTKQAISVSQTQIYDAATLDEVNTMLTEVYGNE